MTIKEVSEKYGVSQAALRYYERAGMIPPVRRTESGIRDYSPADLSWVELALCMRRAGLSVEGMAEYVRLSMEGDSTFGQRLKLLTAQREAMLEQRRRIDESLKRLDYKIGRYEQAVRTGKLDWNE